MHLNYGSATVRAKFEFISINYLGVESSRNSLSVQCRNTIQSKNYDQA